MLAALPALAVGSGNLFVADFDANKVLAYSVGPDGQLTNVGEASAPGSPIFAVITPDAKHLYVTGSTGGVSAFTIGSGGGLEAVSGSPFAAAGIPQGLAVTPDGKHLYVAASQTGALRAYDIESDGALSPVSGSPFPTGEAANNVTITPDGRYAYVANPTRPTWPPSRFSQMARWSPSQGRRSPPRPSPSR